MIPFILEAAFRSLLMALAVWACMRLLRVRAVLAQKVAWVLVLLAAGAMPLAMRAPVLDRLGVRAMQIPARWLQFRHATAPAPTSISASTAASPQAAGEAPVASVRSERSATVRKPAARNRNSESVERATLIFDADSAARPLAPAASAQISIPFDTSLQTKRFWNWERAKSIAIDAYIATCALLLLRMAVGLTIAFRLWRRAQPVTDLPLRLRSAAKVFSSRDLTTPLTIGSAVLLPIDYREWDLEKLRVVLAHERSHVRQGDFYLQALAALHAAIFWFSPLGWWLARRISELGEALGDHAGLEEAKDPSTYAQILLEFAVKPRRSHFQNTLYGPLTGVAMARSSNLSGRIERILNDRRLRLEFLGGRRHAFLTALLVPAALVAVVACIRFAPSVEAAQTQNPVQKTSVPSIQILTPGETRHITVVPQQISTVNFVSPTALLARFTAVNFGLQAPQAPAAPTAPPVPNSPPPAAEGPETRDATDALEQAQALKEMAESDSRNGYSYSHVGNDGEDDFAIVSGKDGDSVNVYGNGQDELKKVREKYHEFIWFRHGGKSYVITDPAIVARCAKMFRQDPALEIRQAQLEKMQADLQVKMEKLEPLKLEATLDSPEFKEQMAKLNAELADLQKVKIKEITDKVNAEVLADLQEKMGEIQGHIGEIQGQIGEKQGELGEKQGELGERMGKLGEEMGKIGEAQGKKAEEASKKMKSVFDQAIKDGKAKPVE